MRRPLLFWALACSLTISSSAASIAAENQPAAADRSIDNVSVSRPTWHRGSGLVYGEVTVRNKNPYSLENVIISCDFFDEWGNKIASKGTALRRPVPPGKTRFSGLEFPKTVRNMQGGACHVLSGERM